MEQGVESVLASKAKVVRMSRCEGVRYIVQTLKINEDMCCVLCMYFCSAECFPSCGARSTTLVSDFFDMYPTSVAKYDAFFSSVIVGPRIIGHSSRHLELTTNVPFTQGHSL